MVRVNVIVVRNYFCSHIEFGVLILNCCILLSGKTHPVIVAFSKSSPSLLLLQNCSII